MRIIKFLCAVAAMGIVWVPAADAANPRIALVIGESAYTDAALPTTANDAGLVAQVLQAAGFDVVGARDLDQKSVRESLRDFLDKANAAGPDMQAFVYFSGRALQFSGDNYLVPIDARIARDSDAPIEAIKLADFTHALATAPGLARVVVIDGARPNPYAQQGQPLAGGLALVDPEPNTVIAFNAAPGSIGVEDSGDYGVYAKSLSGLMRQGGVDIGDVLSQTRIAVNQQTKGAQVPWSAGKLDAPYFLFERAADAPVAARPPATRPLKQLSSEEAYQSVIASDRLEDYEEFLRDHARSTQARRIEAIVAARREALFWRRALEQNSPRAYWTYLKLYPRGPHAYDAGRRLDILSARRAPPPDFTAMQYEDLPPPPPAEIVYADRPVYYFGGDDFGPPPPPPPPAYVVDVDSDDWGDLPPPPPPTLAGVLPTLAIAIPLMIAARAYHDRPHRDGRAPVAAPPPQPRPFGPPPLPQGVRPIAAPPRLAAPPAEARARGRVQFVAPAATAPAGGRPPAPRAPQTPPPAATPLPVNGKAPAPPPAGERTPPPAPTPARTPLPTPNAAPVPLPAPAGPRTPQPTPNGAGAPLPAPAPAPSGVRTPPPAPGRALPTPPAPTPQPMKPGPAELKAPSDAVKPGKAPPEPANPVEPKSDQPRPGKPTPPRAAEPRPEPEAPKAPDVRPAETPLPKASDAPRAPKAVEAPAPRPVEPKPAPRPVEAPRPAPAPKMEAPRPAPAPRVEPPHPAPRVEAPRPAPPPAPRVEAPRPAPPPAPRVEAPRPAPPPAPRVEAPRPAPPPAPAKPAGCHPGAPHC